MHKTIKRTETLVHTTEVQKSCMVLRWLLSSTPHAWRWNVLCRVDGDQTQLMFFHQAQRSICRPLKPQTCTDSERRTSVPRSTHATRSPSPGRRYRIQRMSAELLFVFLLFWFVLVINLMLLSSCLDTVQFPSCVFCTYAFRSFLMSNRVCDWGFDR